MSSASFEFCSPPQRLVLPDGLRLGFLSQPPGGQAAALVRVHAGSHDAPAAYPGLAHFLEHLLFLGSAAYPPAQGLMPFVQGCAGQLNASTRERHTDYFFQVPAEAFAEALKRLLDMLARPLLDPAAQRREREVLQAEFLARAKDRETLCDAAIGTVLAAPHPFAGFHAGHRDTLPVESAEFQQALLGYHQRFYHAGQLELLVAAPCSLEQLQALLRSDECRLPAAPEVCRPLIPLPTVDAAPLYLQIEGSRTYLDLAFVLDGLPDGIAVALDVLATWLGSQAPGSLFAALRGEGWCEAVALRVPYWHAGQGVIIVELQLSEQGMPARAQIVAAVRDWLGFLTRQAPWAELWHEYVRIRQRSLLGKEPLACLRYWVEPAAWQPSTDAYRVQQALQALGAQLRGRAPIVLSVGRAAGTGARIATTGAGFPLQLATDRLPDAAPRQWHWRLPERNRWLDTRPQPRVAPLAAMPCWVQTNAVSGEGALYVRWRFDDGQPPAGLWHVLQAALRRYIPAAAQAGVELRFENHGHGWCLTLFGYAEALPVVLRDLLDVLAKPPASVFGEGQRLAVEAQRPGADELLLRQLMRQLPLLLDPIPPAAGLPLLDQTALTRAWRHARWDVLAVGLAASLSGPLQDALRAMPGMPETQALPAPAAAVAHPYVWCGFGEPAAETALLLFCPLPLRTAPVEAAWRQLSRLMEGAFFRRLRSELQLGYAVFCGFRQFGERAGMFFAVQSPSASAGEILGHVETFLAGFARELDARPDASAAGADFARGGDLRRRAEQIWQARLAGRDSDYPAQVERAMAALRPEDLQHQLQALREAKGGWCVVANAAAPDARWLGR
ncbi:pyrroloquinoline quinone biosynthesis protein PqqF [Stutzerimonas stutzeri]|uniref:Coenzyme PQQ synthesis protein F n=1 Tax=Stutzerimonas stutzeri TaxID=316 RepID=A0A2N8T4V2_STUST|nr:pyrroloquinoline quinone biosynthesis protein PqqF [Stutzerimonas stutzeri]MCQ4324074.1 pyrroloquinoline quinone biosynthesis protein PqqF [Stutzerimonas stutzeri]PNG09774.1 pyrroloquinoline quinone biosynthesis protein PqqF [Stutzerimonas stutzeri]